MVALFELLTPTMAITTFAMFGLGWRSRQFATIAHSLPEHFHCLGVLRRRADGSEQGLPVFTTLTELADARPDMVLIALPRAEMPDAIRAVIGKGLPVLAETPPAADVPALRQLWHDLGNHAPVQIAEQYPLMPFHSAVRSMIDQGRIGQPTQVDMSVAHGYHGMAMIRRLLGVGFEPVKIRGLNHVASVVNGPGRQGPPMTGQLVPSTRSLVSLDFGHGRLGMYDFDFEQYFSWIRSSRLQVRGTRGEIRGHTARWLIDHQTPMQAEIERCDGGQLTNLEGQHHQGYRCAGQWLYRNPWAPARLSDDEIAMASILAQARLAFTQGQIGYSLAEACHDQMLALLADQAAASGMEVISEPQPWNTL